MSFLGAAVLDVTFQEAEAFSGSWETCAKLRLGSKARSVRVSALEETLAE